MRTGIVEKVWEEEIPNVAGPSPVSTSPISPAAAAKTGNAAQGTNGVGMQTSKTTVQPPAPPPRRRGIWGGIASAIGERAASWGGDSSSGSESNAGKKQSPPALPPKAEVRRMPPPLSQQSSSTSTPAPLSPPPLPRRRVAAAKDHAAAGGSASSGATIGVHADHEASVEHDHDGGDWNPSTPTRVVFDASETQSPMRPKDKALPPVGLDDVVEHTAEVAPVASEPTADSAKVDTVAPDASTATSSKEAEKAPEEPTVEPTSDGPRDNEGVAATAPVDGTESASPAASTVPAAVPDRVASPAVPPPLPKRAAARRPVPAPPGSRPTTPVVKSEEEGKGQVNGNDGKVEGKEGAKKPETREQGENEEEKKGEVKEGVKEEVVKEQTQEEKKQEEIVQKDVPAENGKVSDSKEQSDPQSSDDEFVDAPAPAATTPQASTESAPVPEILTTASSTPEINGSADDKKDEEPEPIVESDRPADDAQEKTAADKRASVVTLKDAEGIATLQDEIDATTTVNGIDSHLSSSPHTQNGTDSGAKNGTSRDGEEAKADSVPDHDPNSREVYIGDATWEERTWKELVRLKEDMFWARVGGLRP